MKFILICTAITTIWAKPVEQKHYVLLTPQARLHLEPTVIHHLSPVGRFTNVHNDETIVYAPIEEGRSAEGASARQNDEIANAQQNIIAASQAVTNNCITAGAQLLDPSNNFPALIPGYPLLFPSDSKDGAKVKDASGKIEYNLIPATAELPRFFPLAPEVPHVVDIVHAPVFLSTIKGRSLNVESEPEKPLPLVSPVLEEKQPEIKQQAVQIDAQLEDKTDFGRVLEETQALKDDLKKDTPAKLGNCNLID